MSWNNSFADDAFANGKVPGWEPWLTEPRAERAYIIFPPFLVRRTVFTLEERDAHVERYGCNL